MAKYFLCWVKLHESCMLHEIHCLVLGPLASLALSLLRPPLLLLWFVFLLDPMISWVNAIYELI